MGIFFFPCDEFTFTWAFLSFFASRFSPPSSSFLSFVFLVWHCCVTSGTGQTFPSQWPMSSHIKGYMAPLARSWLFNHFLDGFNWNGMMNGAGVHSPQRGLIGTLSWCLTLDRSPSGHFSQREQVGVWVGWGTCSDRKRFHSQVWLLWDLQGPCN